MPSKAVSGVAWVPVADVLGTPAARRDGSEEATAGPHQTTAALWQQPSPPQAITSVPDTVEGAPQLTGEHIGVRVVPFDEHGILIVRPSRLGLGCRRDRRGLVLIVKRTGARQTVAALLDGQRLPASPVGCLPQRLEGDRPARRVVRPAPLVATRPGKCMAAVSARRITDGTGPAVLALAPSRVRDRADDGAELRGELVIRHGGIGTDELPDLSVRQLHEVPAARRRVSWHLSCIVGVRWPGGIDPGRCSPQVISAGRGGTGDDRRGDQARWRKPTTRSRRSKNFL